MRIHKTKFAFLTKRHLEHLNKFTGYRSVMWRRLDFCIVYVWHAKNWLSAIRCVGCGNGNVPPYSTCYDAVR